MDHLPGGQIPQVIPSPALPAAQVSHPFIVMPPPHFLHSARPGSSENVPGSQSIHREPGEDIFPVAHSMHLASVDFL